MSGTLEGCSFIGCKASRQDRDTYIECEIPPGIYYLYIELEWQPETFKWLKKQLNFTVNSYGPTEVQFSEDMSSKLD